MIGRGDTSPAADHAATFRAELPRLLPRLRAFVRGFGIGERYADDLAQDVVLAVWLAIQSGGYTPDPRVNPGEAITMFVFGIASHRALDLVKSAAYRRELLALVALDEDDVIDRAVDRRTERGVERLDARDVLHHLEQLSPDERHVLVMLAEGYEQHEVTSSRRDIRAARERLIATIDPSERRAIWPGAPAMIIRRQASGPRKAEPEEDGLETDFWPCSAFN